MITGTQTAALRPVVRHFTKLSRLINEFDVVLKAHNGRMEGSQVVKSEVCNVQYVNKVTVICTVFLVPTEQGCLLWQRCQVTLVLKLWKNVS
jgi:hypothetical protein